QAVSMVEAGGDASKVKAVLKPLHLMLIGAAVIVIGIVLSMMFRAAPVPEAPRKQGVATSIPSADEPEQQPEKTKGKEPAKSAESIVGVPVVEPEMKRREPAPKVEKMTVVVPAPAPPPPPVPAVMPPVAPVTPPPETPLEAIQRLEERDPELARLVADFGAEWSANPETNVESEMQDLADKYIPALQRSLSGVVLQQRDFVLSEISQIANHEPLGEPDLLWPAVLKTLRKAYDAQREAIQGRAGMAEQKMRAAQGERVLQKARERAAAGKVEAAKLAEVVAAELAKLKTAPSLKALKQNAAGSKAAEPIH
ncbi:MAG: hypothetical protein B7Z37_21150, partial [Verrucomicrobia bacterium 12-59-8]